MSVYLSYPEDELQNKGALYTAREIASQPRIWMDTYFKFLEVRSALSDFLSSVYAYENLNVILTGAGTSAFIGEALEGVLQKNIAKPVRAVATTDLVTHPDLYLLSQKTILLISFARSGNSPESVKAVELAEQLCGQVFHIIITCNDDGQLAQRTSGKNSFVFVLPPETNDRSLAMTSSFTSMLLSGLLLAEIGQAPALRSMVEQTASYAQKIITQYGRDLQKISQLPFERAVFLGSGSMRGIARESHLKLQELTDGAVVSKFDTFLGFRHGPMAVADKRTLLVFLFSNDSYVLQYERDLLAAINKNGSGIFRLGIMERDMEGDMDLKIILNEGQAPLSEAFLLLPAVIPAQLLGFFKSLNLGLKPDSPSVSGAISRVVQGVVIYPYRAHSHWQSA